MLCDQIGSDPRLRPELEKFWCFLARIVVRRGDGHQNRTRLSTF